MTEHIYAAEHPETTHVRPGGFTLWFTGLSGAGKTTIAHLVGPELDAARPRRRVPRRRRRPHAPLARGSASRRRTGTRNIERIGWVASRLTRQGGAVIVAAISPYKATRQQARDWVEAVGAFVEVHVKALGRRSAPAAT